MDSWRDMTLGDVAKGFTRYRPFILAVLAMLLVLVALPSDQRPGSDSANGASTNVRVEGATQDQSDGATADEFAGGTTDSSTSVDGDDAERDADGAGLRPRDRSRAHPVTRRPSVRAAFQR